MAKVVSKTKLVDDIAKKTKVEKSKTKAVVDAFIEAVVDALSKGNKVSIPGFGTWYVANRKQRKGRNPKTGEVITIPKMRAPRFKPGNALKKAVAKK